MSHPDPKQTQGKVDQVFMALADPTRRQLVRMLAEQDRTVGELAQPFPVSLAAISKHIKVLEAAGIVARRVDGRVHTLALRPEALSGALDWITATATSGASGSTRSTNFYPWMKTAHHWRIEGCLN